LIEEVAFPWQWATLRGLLLLPEAHAGKPPRVIMARGASARTLVAIDQYAQVFQRAGMAVLLYDQRNFGRRGRWSLHA